MKEFSLFTVLYKTFRFFGVFFLCLFYPKAYNAGKYITFI